MRQAGNGRHVLVIFNPTAGWRRHRRLHRTLEALVDRGCRVTLKRTGCRGDAERFAREAAESGGFDVVVAAGGDGTINEVANGLEGCDTPLAVIPLGTANVFAIEIGLRRQVAAIADIIAHGQPHPIYLGHTGGRAFVMMLGVGFDGRAVAGIDLEFKRRFGKLAYVVSGLRELIRGNGAGLRVIADGQPYEGAWIVVSKGAHYGGAFVIARGASIEEAAFRLCIFPRARRIDLLGYLLALGLGRLHRLKTVTFLRATTVFIEGTDSEPIQADGDIIGQLPISVHVGGRPINLLAPARASV
ncbi:MAG: diacylglycerol kinase family protein [Acetobacterales bacterium]